MPESAVLDQRERRHQLDGIRADRALHDGFDNSISVATSFHADEFDNSKREQTFAAGRTGIIGGGGLFAGVALPVDDGLRDCHVARFVTIGRDL